MLSFRTLKTSLDGRGDRTETRRKERLCDLSPPGATSSGAARFLGFEDSEPCPATKERVMRRLGLLCVGAALFIGACVGDTPVGVDPGTEPGGSVIRRIPPAPKMVPFFAHEENTIVCIAPTPDCQPGPDGILHASFPGVIEGDFIGRGTIAATSEVDFSVFPFQQTTQSTITAANGDKLFWNAVGTAVPGPGPGDVIFSGNFTFVGGTGRFATATGGGTYAGTANTIAAVGQFDINGMISR